MSAVLENYFGGEGQEGFMEYVDLVRKLEKILSLMFRKVSGFWQPDCKLQKVQKCASPKC